MAGAGAGAGAEAGAGAGEGAGPEAGPGAGAGSVVALVVPEVAGICGPLKRPLNLPNMSRNLKVLKAALPSTAYYVVTPKELKGPPAMTAFSSTNTLAQRKAPTIISNL